MRCLTIRIDLALATQSYNFRFPEAPGRVIFLKKLVAIQSLGLTDTKYLALNIVRESQASAVESIANSKIKHQLFKEWGQAAYVGLPGYSTRYLDLLHISPFPSDCWVNVSTDDHESAKIVEFQLYYTSGEALPNTNK